MSNLTGDYTVYERSMNGIKTISDGISVITDGTATHDKIFYSDQIEATNGSTIVNQVFVTTTTVNCDTLNTTTTNADNLNAIGIDSLRLRINDVSNNIIYDLNGNTSTATFNGQTYFNNTVTVTNKNIVQTQTGEINQSGTGTNDLKDTNINGFLVVGSNITQNGGSTSLKDVTCDNLTMRSGKSITQSGTGISNTFAGTTTTKDLVILDSVTFPSNVTIPGTTTTADIIMDGSSVIIQDLTVEPSGKLNVFRTTKTLDLLVDGSFSMIKAGSSATLKNTVIQGTAEIQGDITQTTGSTSLKTISCNNITLNVDQNITQSGTGYITQSGTGTNTLKAIDLTSNSNLTFNGNGIISQPLTTSQNILNNFRCAGYGIVGGRNNTVFSNTQNIQNNNGLQLQFNRDNTTQYSFLMNNRGTGGNGGFRLQRYVAGVFLDEPLTIDDNITMNKNLSVPGGSISCSSATIGAISQSEIDCLDNCTTNIQTKFNTLDSQIASLQSSASSSSTALTGISYTSGTDTTLVDNNLTVSSGKNLLIGTTNVGTTLTTQGSNITTLQNRTSGMTYTSITDTTTFDNNVQISAGKKLYIGPMDVEGEINALEISFTTGTINTTDLTATNITATSTLFANDMSSNTLTVNGVSNLNGTTSVNGTFNTYNNVIFNQTVTAQADVDFNAITRCNNNLNVSGNIQSKLRSNLAVSKNIVSNLTLTFPLDEYNVITQSATIGLTLPAVSTSAFNGVATTFVLGVKTANVTISPPAGTTLYDINGNSIASILLSQLGFLNVKLMTIALNWYVIDFIKNPDYITTTSINTTSIGTDTLTANTSISSLGSVSGITGSFTTQVTTPRMVGNVLFSTGWIKSRSNIPGYMFDGGVSFQAYPIPCSMKGFKPSDVDDYWYLSPGFKFTIYNNDNYGGTSFDLVNDGDTPTVFASGATNTRNSIKVFFRPTTSDAYTEITMPTIS